MFKLGLRNIFTEHELDVPKELVENLAHLRFAYADLSCKYKTELQSCSEAKRKLAEYLQHLFPEFGCEFPDNFNTLVNDKSSLFNIYYLKEICEIFPPNVR